MSVARRAAALYAANAKVAAVVAAGSVGSGRADKWSDLELDIYWHESPTDEDRRAPIDALGGAIHQFWPFSEREEEWGEEYDVDGLSIGISSFTVDTAERFLRRVVEEGVDDPLMQMRVAAILACTPITGTSLLKGWKERAERYPDVLRRTAVLRYLDPDRLAGWHQREPLARRDDHLAVHELLSRAVRMVLGALHGLNRMYVANPSLKWEASSTANFVIAPADLQARLAQAWTGDLTTRLATVEALLLETVQLAERELDTPVPELRRALGARRAALVPPGVEPRSH
jgi:hypothetical protein